MAEILSNNASGNLNANITNVATSLVLQAGQGATFPSTGNFRILCESEIMLVGARSGDTLSSITRGIEGTANVAHNSPAAVYHVLTAGGFQQFMVDNAVGKPSGIISGEAVVWNGSTWARSSVTPITASSVAAGILASQLQNYTSADGSKAFFEDGTWKVPTSFAPTHLPGMASGSLVMTVVANQAYLTPIGNVTAVTPLTRLSWGLVTVVAGNYDVGIYYSDDEATFTRLGSLGLTAQPAAGQIISTLATQTITPVIGRRWYYAIALSTASTIMAAGTTATNATGILGYFKTTSFPLPATLTTMTAIGAAPVPVIHGAV